MVTPYWDRVNSKLRELMQQREKFSQVERDEIKFISEMKQRNGRVIPSHVKKLNKYYEKLKNE